MTRNISFGIRIAGSRLHVLLLLAFFPLFLCEIISSAAEDPICPEQLIAEMAHPDPNLRWHAVAALGASGDRRAVPPLIKALEKDMKERTGIAMAIIPALGQLGDERAIPLLLKALHKLDEDWLGREAAARALGDIGSAEAVPDLIRAAWQAETRNAAIEALASIGDPRAIDVLLSALSEPEEPEAREAAIEGLITIGEPAIAALITKLEIRSKEYPQNRERALAAMILGEIGDRRAIDSLTRALDDPSQEVRKNVETALRKLTN